MASSVHHGYHALSIDDARKVFHPTLWHIQKEGKSLLNKIAIDPIKIQPDDPDRHKCEQTVKQVWFCGSHTDIGGGYPEQGISNITLAWMFERAVEHGLKKYEFHPVDIKQDIKDVIHDPRSTRLARLLYKKKTRNWDLVRCGKPLLHESVLERVKIDDSYKPWILDMFKEGEYEIEPWDNKEPEDFSYLEH